MKAYYRFPYESTALRGVESARSAPLRFFKLLMKNLAWLLATLQDQAFCSPVLRLGRLEQIMVRCLKQSVSRLFE